MEVIEIIKKYIEDNGYDGLYQTEGECACKIDDLYPCGEGGLECNVGYKTPCPKIEDPEGEYHCECLGKEGDWHISATKESK